MGKNNSAPESLAQTPDVSNKACYPNTRKNCDSNISYSLIQTKSPYNIHSQLNDKQNGYTRQRFDQNNIIKQSDHNNDQQQLIPIRITTRRVKIMGRKSNSELRNRANKRNNEDFRMESWERDKIGWFQFYY